MPDHPVFKDVEGFIEDVINNHGLSREAALDVAELMTIYKLQERQGSTPFQKIGVTEEGLISFLVSIWHFSVEAMEQAGREMPEPSVSFQAAVAMGMGLGVELERRRHG